MREIEFRAWNKEKKIMCFDNEDDSASYWDGVYSSEIGLINHSLKRMRKEYVIMQYTGKKDKNGTKIFEGDIVLVDEYEQEIAIIKWDEECGNFYFELDNLYLTFDEYYANELEVVGNIYDNPELLGDGDDIKE